MTFSISWVDTFFRFLHEQAGLRSMFSFWTELHQCFVGNCDICTLRTCKYDKNRLYNLPYTSSIHFQNALCYVLQLGSPYILEPFILLKDCRYACPILACQPHCKEVTLACLTLFAHLVSTYEIRPNTIPSSPATAVPRCWPLSHGYHHFPEDDLRGCPKSVHLRGGGEPGCHQGTLG